MSPDNPKCQKCLSTMWPYSIEVFTDADKQLHRMQTYKCSCGRFDAEEMPNPDGQKRRRAA
jgi:hypothetical protein